MTTSPLLQLDRSRPFFQVFGEREPTDPHAGAAYTQDGLHFDAQGVFMQSILDDPKATSPKRREELMKVVERRTKTAKKLPKSASEAPLDPSRFGSKHTEEPTNAPPAVDSTVDLGMWLRGQAQYQWHQVSAQILARYGQRVQNKRDAVSLLVLDESVVPEDELAPDIAAALPPKQAA